MADVIRAVGIWLACAGMAFGASDSDAIVRLLNARAGTSPKVYATAVSKVRQEADDGGLLQRYIIAIVSTEKPVPAGAQLSEATRAEWLSNARGRVRELAEQKNNALAWYLLSLETGDAAALERAAKGGNVQALNAWGNELVAHEREKEGFACFCKAAVQRDTNAFYNLGMCYMQGYGCTMDVGRAFQCFRAAAEKGHPEAINNIGGFYRDGIIVPTNIVLSARWFKKSAELGNAYGQLNYALALQRGDGAARDERAAARLMRVAGEQGCAEAMDAYAMCLYQGRGVDRNITEAIRWFKASAEGGCPNAMENLSECYARGEGVEKDIVASAEWRMRAKAARGESEAKKWVKGRGER